MATNTTEDCGCESKEPTTATDVLGGGVSRRPIACTLGRDDMAARERDLRAAFEHLVGSSATEGGFRWTFRAGPDVVPKVRLIAEREASCCAFARFDVSTSAGEVVLEVAAPPEASAALGALRTLPSELGRGEGALARTLRSAGLSGE